MFASSRPERLGLCGAYNWLDGKAAYEIDPTGPNQPLIKGECIDPVRGQWENINDYVYANSKQTLARFNAYSLLEDPMTSCGCFEAIVALMPECNGVMIVNREYLGETPAGMKFSTTGEHRRRRPAGAGLHRRRQSLHHQPQVHLGGRRPPAHRLDAARS